MQDSSHMTTKNKKIVAILLLHLSIKMGMLHLYVMNITVLNVGRHNADKHSC